jgi:hypothetical protein
VAIPHIHAAAEVQLVLCLTLLTRDLEQPSNDLRAAHDRRREGLLQARDAIEIRRERFHLDADEREE